MGLAVAMAALTYLPVTSYIIITLDLPQHDFETNIGMAGPALIDDLCVCQIFLDITDNNFPREDTV